MTLLHYFEGELLRITAQKTYFYNNKNWQLPSKKKRQLYTCTFQVMEHVSIEHFFSKYLHISLQHQEYGHSCWKLAKLEHFCRLAVCSLYRYTVHHPALSVHLPGQSRHWAVPLQLKTFNFMKITHWNKYCYSITTTDSANECSAT